MKKLLITLCLLPCALNADTIDIDGFTRKNMSAKPGTRNSCYYLKKGEYSVLRRDYGIDICLKDISGKFYYFSNIGYYSVGEDL